MATHAGQQHPGDAPSPYQIVPVLIYGSSTLTTMCTCAGAERQVLSISTPLVVLGGSSISCSSPRAFTAVA